MNDPESTKRKMCHETFQEKYKVHKTGEYIESTDLEWKAEPILSDEYYQDVLSVPVFVAEILNMKKISQLVKNLTAKYPLGNLQHLKRVAMQSLDETGSKSMVIIIKECIDSETFEKPSQLLPNASCWDGLGSSLHLCLVPKDAPLTRKQYEQCMLLWPTQFHENKHLAMVLSHKFFHPVDLLKMDFYMKQALKTARMASFHVGVVVVDPSSGEVVTMAEDRRDQHPLQHAVMVAINRVAEIQRRALAMREEAQRQNDQQYSDLSQSKPLPYLCTGYDLYVTREPCTMCSMGLVHSRIGRVFYGAATSQGALGSALKLHTLRHLNHRFQVWKGVCQRECTLLCS